MPTRIVVSSNCQTAGIARTVQAIMGDVEVIALPQHELPADDDALRARLQGSDVWVTVERDELFTGSGGGPRIVKCPRLCFSAFHPDIAFIRNERTGEVPATSHSRIIAWAYSHGLGVGDTARLFDHDVFEALGYFDRWDREIGNLRQYYAQEFDIDFDPFYLSLKREGLFMHDLEHPTATALVKLGKQVAGKIGASERELATPITIPDVWAHGAWPVYPEIADQFGLEGSYVWSELANVADGLPGYIAHVFARYRSQDIEAGRLGILTDGGFADIGETLDPILMPFAGRS